MKILIVLLLVVSALGQGRIRREIREIIDERAQPLSELQDYLDGVRCLMRQPGDTRGRTVWDEFSNIHNVMNRLNHGFPRFLPWHRLLLLAIENAMSQCVGRKIVCPYWNSAIDAATSGGMRNSVMWKIFGGNGDTAFDYMCNIPNRHKLRRSFDFSTTLATSEHVARMMDTKDWVSMADRLEWDLHARPHIFTGGDMSTMYSPNDPLFYLHHANVDRLWHEWQEDNPPNATGYYGRNPETGGPASLNDVMTLGTFGRKYQRDLTVGQLMNARSLDFDYSDGVKAVRATSTARPTTRTTTTTTTRTTTRRPTSRFTIETQRPTTSRRDTTGRFTIETQRPTSRDTERFTIETQRPTSSPSSNTVCATVDVYFRSGPSSSAKALGVAYKQERVTQIGETNGWAQVIHPRLGSGYIFGRYVQASACPSASDVNDETGTVVCATTAVNVRRAPNTSTDPLGVAFTGERVTQLSVSSGWANVIHPRFGRSYIYGRYLGACSGSSSSSSSSSGSRSSGSSSSGSSGSSGSNSGSSRSSGSSTGSSASSGSSSSSSSSGGWGSLFSGLKNTFRNIFASKPDVDEYDSAPSLDQTSSAAAETTAVTTSGSETTTAPKKRELPTLSQIPAYWVRMNRIPPNRLEELHQKMNRFVSWFNKQPNLKPRHYGRDVLFFRPRLRDERWRKKFKLFTVVGSYKMYRRSVKKTTRKPAPRGGFNNWRPPQPAFSMDGTMGGGKISGPAPSSSSSSSSSSSPRYRN